MSAAVGLLSHLPISVQNEYSQLAMELAGDGEDKKGGLFLKS